MAERKIPAALKPVQPYLLLSKQFAKRDPIITYYGKYLGLSLLVGIQAGLVYVLYDSCIKQGTWLVEVF